jgi:hypothetical protein
MRLDKRQLVCNGGLYNHSKANIWNRTGSDEYAATASVRYTIALSGERTRE